jgi:histone H1/5
MSYKAGIITAITGLKDRTGSSSISIKKSMQANLPAGKKWLNAMFLGALKKMVAEGVLTKTKDSYKISADYKKKASKPKKVPKKKTAPKKAAPKKKSAPKKKAAPKKKSAPKKKAVSLNAFI